MRLSVCVGCVGADLHVGVCGCVSVCVRVRCCIVPPPTSYIYSLPRSDLPFVLGFASLAVIRRVLQWICLLSSRLGALRGEVSLNANIGSLGFSVRCLGL